MPLNVNATLDMSGSDALMTSLRNLRYMLGNPGTLMVSWMKILVEGNRRGVLAGIQADSSNMPPVTYRPRGRGRSLTPAQRNLANARLRRGQFAGFGMYAAGMHNNLTHREYERLAGPPLAPRRQFSRVITNYHTDYTRFDEHRWQVTYWWQDVVSVKGVPFLNAHFTGATTGRGHRVHLPRRDLRGIRVVDQLIIDKAMVNWANDVIRNS